MPAPHWIAARLILPLAVLVLLASAALVGTVYLMARESDERHQLGQRHALSAALDEFRLVFADFTLRRASDLSAFAWQSPDLTVADIGNRLAPTGLSRYRHERAYLLAGDGSLIAAFPPDQTTAPAVIKRIAATFRVEDALRRERSAQAPELHGGTIAPVVADFVNLDGEPAVVAVATVRSPRLAARGGGDLPVLATVARLDLARIHVLEATSGVTRLQVNSEKAGTDLNSLVVHDRDGRIAGWFSWDSHGPLIGMMLRFGPLLGAIGVALFGLACLSVWQVRRSTRQLADSERRAHALAYEDPLTKLPNLRMVNAAIDHALSVRAPGQTVVFGYADLDNFREVNESIGHSGGDRLLVMAADRLRTALGAGVVLGRSGGDRFALVMTCEAPDAALSVAEHAVDIMSRPFCINGQMLHNGVSIGLAESSEDGARRDDLVIRADLALRAAKSQGGGRVMCFKPAMEEETHDRRFIKRELQRAVAEGTLDLHYQPIVAAADGCTVGVEALLRWEHPIRGAIPPSVFVPIAEQTGLMEALGEFVLRRALADASRWSGVYIAINLSPVQVRSHKLVPLVSQILGETGIPASRVVLEVTEGVLIDDPAEAKVRLDALRALGVRMALDDFGVGYSSLGYLQRFAFDKLKIDRTFVAPLGRSADAAAMVQAIVALGRALGLSVLAEGVETDEQRLLLRLAGCDEMQGYRFARPMPREAIDALLAKWNARPIPTRGAVKS